MQAGKNGKILRLICACLAVHIEICLSCFPLQFFPFYIVVV